MERNFIQLLENKKNKNLLLYNTLAVHRLYVVWFKCWGGDQVKKERCSEKWF